MKEFKKCKPMPKGNSFEFKRVNSLTRDVIMDGRVLGEIQSMSTENRFVVRNEFGLVLNGGDRIFFNELDAIHALRDAYNDEVEDVNRILKEEKTTWFKRFASWITPWAILATIL